MTYNLGSAGMSSFGTFISLIKKGDYASAASDIRGTLWCRQVGNRCSRDASIIQRGCSAELGSNAGSPPSSKQFPWTGVVVAVGVVGGVMVAILTVLSLRKHRCNKPRYVIVQNTDYGTMTA